MTALRKDAMELLEQIPEDRLYFIVQIMQGVSGCYKTEDQKARDEAFDNLESLRKKVSHLDYEKELESCREEKYGTANFVRQSEGKSSLTEFMKDIHARNYGRNL